MVQTYDRYLGLSDEEVIHRLRDDNRRKPSIAIAVIAAALIAGVGAAYLSYRDVPAPANPANARPHLMEPYQ